MRRVSIVLIMASLFLVGIPKVDICLSAEEPPEWLFDRKDEIQTWTGMNNLDPLVVTDVKDNKGVKRTILKTKSLGGDPYVFPNGGWAGFTGVEPFEGKKYPIIYIGVRVNVSSAWQIYYITDEDAAYSERQRQNFQVDASDDFLDLEFKMVEGGWQDENIMGFRLDPGTIGGVEAEIDYISFKGIPGGGVKAVEYSGKLAVKWGAIRN